MGYRFKSLRSPRSQTVCWLQGFAYNVKEIFDPVITRYGNCLKAAQGLRRLGSAALDLCYVACGRFEGFWEQNLKPWDTAAGCPDCSRGRRTGHNIFKSTRIQVTRMKSWRPTDIFTKRC